MFTIRFLIFLLQSDYVNEEMENAEVIQEDVSAICL